MSTTTVSPETTDKHLSGEETPVDAGEHAAVMDIPRLREELLVPPAQETTLGRMLQPNEALSSDLPLVLVRSIEHGKEMVLPGYYACVGTMPCAATEYYLLVRWEHRESGRQGEQRVVLPEHIRVIDGEMLLLSPSAAASSMSATASEPSAALPEDLLPPLPESPASIQGTREQSHERYPQLQHSAKRKS